MPIKKFLILSASNGAGHVRAAEAIQRTAQTGFAHTITVEHCDVAHLLSRTNHFLLMDLYNSLAYRFPASWSFIYHHTNSPQAIQRANRFLRLAHRIDGSPVQNFVDHARPDHIIYTHFFPPSFLQTQTPSSLVITDYDVHEAWLGNNHDYYFVSTDDMMKKMVDHGIDPKKIVLSGIPIQKEFYEEKSKDIIAKKYAISAKNKIILVLSGGYGFMRMDHIVHVMMESTEPLTIIAVAGKSETLKSLLEHLVPPPHIRLIVVGWTNAIDEYMRLADIIVSKPGGLTTTECITLQKPFIAVNPVPGHEEANVRYLEKQRYGVLAKTKEDLLLCISQKPQTLSPGYQPEQKKESARIILETILGR